MMLQIITQLQFNSGDPITSDGGVSAGWVLVGAVTLIGVLIVYILSTISKNNTEALNAFKEELKNIHKRIDIREDEHDELKDKHLDLGTKVLLIEASQRIHKDTQAEDIANVILNKLGALQGDTGKHANNPLFNKL